MLLAKLKALVELSSRCATAPGFVDSTHLVNEGRHVSGCVENNYLLAPSRVRKNVAKIEMPTNTIIVLEGGEKS